MVTCRAVGLFVEKGLEGTELNTLHQVANPQSCLLKCSGGLTDTLMTPLLHMCAKVYAQKPSFYTVLLRFSSPKTHYIQHFPLQLSPDPPSWWEGLAAHPKHLPRSRPFGSPILTTPLLKFDNYSR